MSGMSASWAYREVAMELWKQANPFTRFNHVEIRAAVDHMAAQKENEMRARRREENKKK